jgi:hypothetical protein
MGFPTHTFSILGQVEKVIGDLRPGRFPLIGFVLHDPIEHQDFGQHLLERFDQLHAESGPDLLFFALMNLPGFGNSNEYWRSREQRAAWTFAAQFGIPVESLPCIVLTDDIQSNRSAWITTSESELSEQLRTLGIKATTHRRLGRFKALLDDLDLDDFARDNTWGWEAFGRPFAKKLEDVAQMVFTPAPPGMGVMVLGRILSDVIKPYSISSAVRFSIPREDFEVNETLSRPLGRVFSFVRKYLRTRQQEESTAPGKRIEEATISIASRDGGDAFEKEKLALLTLSSLASDYAANVSLPIKAEGLDLTNANLLRSAATYEMIARGANLDMSLAALGYGKTFEKEINLSVVQWARGRCGVDLPGFFCRYQPGVQAIVLPIVDRPKPIDLNKGTKSAWHPPGLGQSELACIALGEKGLPPDWTPDKWSAFLSEWKVIRIRRNEVAHDDVDPEGAATTTIKKALTSLDQKGLVTEMVRLKQLYRGR